MTPSATPSTAAWADGLEVADPRQRLRDAGLRGACGRTEDVDCVHGSAPCLTPSSTAGYAVDEAEIVFWGLCPDCGSATPADQSHHHEEGRS